MSVIIATIDKPFPLGDYVAETQDPHGYTLLLQSDKKLAIPLGTGKYDLLHGNRYRVCRNALYCKPGLWWNGSNVVPDRPSCLLASLVHDCLCDGINHSHLGRWKRWRLRRAADRLYADICRWQGMWTWLAWVRFLGLRIASPMTLLAWNYQKK